MVANQNREKPRGAEPHPFAGCNQLLEHYMRIGAELLKYEGRRRHYGFGEAAAFREFREGISFLPVEVLESYLEDLLDPSATDEYLFLRSSRPLWLSGIVTLVGIGTALGLGLHTASQGAPLFSAFSLTLFAATPFALYWHLGPRSGARRRMYFAQVLSHEIARRRGRSKDDGAGAPSTFPLGELLGRRSETPVAGAARLSIRRVPASE